MDGGRHSHRNKLMEGILQEQVYEWVIFRTELFGEVQILVQNVRGQLIAPQIFEIALNFLTGERDELVVVHLFFYKGANDKSKS